MAFGGSVGFGTSTAVPRGCGCDGRVASGFGVAGAGFGGSVGCGSSAGADVAGGAWVGCAGRGGWVGWAGGSGTTGACEPEAGGACVGESDGDRPDGG